MTNETLPNKFRYERKSNGQKVLATITPDHPDYYTVDKVTVKDRLVRAFPLPYLIYKIATGTIKD
jgi:hypothetical protein